MATATPAKAAPKARPATLGALIDAIHLEREKKRLVEEDVKKISERIAELEEQIMAQLDEQGLTQSRGSKASVSVTSSVVADVQDWDSFWPYVAKNKFWHLIQRRVSDPSYRELLEQGKKIPGVQPFTKRKLNLRSL